MRDLRIFLLLMAPGLLIVAVLMMIESVTHQHIVQPFFSSITGIGWGYRSDFRLGLMRAQGPFDHPILAGIFLASFICLYWMSGLRGAPRYMGIAASFLGFFAVSSGALLAIVFSIVLVGYNWLTERVANLSWRLFFVFTALFLFAAELGTGAGAFGLVIRVASLNSISGYARINIWEHGSASVAKHPWFGIGYADWERPIWMGDSVDNFWLLLAMRFGLPAVCFIALATVIALVTLVRRSAYSNIFEARTERGVAMALSVFALTLISVAPWLSPQTWFYMLLGIAVSLANAPRPILRPARPAALPVLDLVTREHPPESAPPHRS
ncbi:MAG: O-antigen ligase family protein [Porphyrobacter sp.]|nr:O-antigen ligase family protein [Porphyrobacter sp.]